MFVGVFIYLFLAKALRPGQKICKNKKHENKIGSALMPSTGFVKKCIYISTVTQVHK